MRLIERADEKVLHGLFLIGIILHVTNIRLMRGQFDQSIDFSKLSTPLTCAISHVNGQNVIKLTNRSRTIKLNSNQSAFNDKLED
jgi:hypothetical protein